MSGTSRNLIQSEFPHEAVRNAQARNCIAVGSVFNGMFCPKCGSENVDELKFCRGCGADLSQLLAMVDGKAPATNALSEKYLEQFSGGVRGLLMGGGFVLVAVVGYLITSNALPVSLFAMLLSVFFLATGTSRLIHAAGLRRLSNADAPTQLAPSEADFIQPRKSIYDTDDLVSRPISVTDRTTRHSEMDSERGR